MRWDIQKNPTMLQIYIFTNNIQRRHSNSMSLFLESELLSMASFCGKIFL